MLLGLLQKLQDNSVNKEKCFNNCRSRHHSERKYTHFNFSSCHTQ